jgi:XapX domain-containing protein
MRLYLASLGAGLLVGVIYSLMNVRSPAPPVVALVGLLGILAGEQVVPLARQMLAGNLAGGGLASRRICVPYFWHAARPACERR